jgi:hypothetical protein
LTPAEIYGAVRRDAWMNYRPAELIEADGKEAAPDSTWARFSGGVGARS